MNPGGIPPVIKPAVASQQLVPTSTPHSQFYNGAPMMNASPSAVPNNSGYQPYSTTMVPSPTTTATSTPHLQPVNMHQVMRSQQEVFAAQLKELHRLIAIQKTLTNVDPITGQILNTSNAVKQDVPQPVIATATATTSVQAQATTVNPNAEDKKDDKKKKGKGGRYPLEISNALQSSFNANPNPPDEEYARLAKELNMDEKKIRKYFANKRTSAKIKTVKEDDASWLPEADAALLAEAILNRSTAAHAAQSPTNAGTPTRTQQQQQQQQDSKNAEEEELKRKKELAKKKQAEDFKRVENALEELLDDTGEVSVPENIVKLAKLMNETEVLQGRLLLLEALDQTTKPDLLRKFVEADGLKAFNSWIIDVKNKKQFKALRVVLKSLKRLPVTMDALQRSSLGKTVNKLKKELPNEDVKPDVNKLIENWSKLLTKKREHTQVDGTASSAATAGASAAATADPTKAKKPRTEGDDSTAPDAKAKKDDSSRSTSGLFSMAPAKKTSSLAPDYLKENKRKVQSVDLVEEKTQAKLTSAYVSRPMSADDIKKSKFKKSILGEPSSSAPAVAVPAATAQPASTTITTTTTTTTTTSTPTTAASPTATSKPVQSTAAAAAAASSSSSSTTTTPTGPKVARAVLKKVTSYPTPEELNAGAAAPGQSPRKRKRGITWASGDSLFQVKIFQKEDEVEEAPTLPSLAQPLGTTGSAFERERALERQLLQQSREQRRKRIEDMKPSIPWRFPQPYDDPAVVELLASLPPVESREAAAQAERNKNVDPVFYLNVNFIPPSPGSPPHEPDYLESSVPVFPSDQPNQMFQQQPAPPPSSLTPQPFAAGLPMFPPQMPPGGPAPPQPPQQAPAPEAPNADVLKQLAENPDLISSLLGILTSVTSSTSNATTTATTITPTTTTTTMTATAPPPPVFTSASAPSTLPQFPQTPPPQAPTPTSYAPYGMPPAAGGVQQQPVFPPPFQPPPPPPQQQQQQPQHSTYFNPQQQPQSFAQPPIYSNGNASMPIVGQQQQQQQQQQQPAGFYKNNNVNANFVGAPVVLSGPLPPPQQPQQSAGGNYYNNNNNNNTDGAGAGGGGSNNNVPYKTVRCKFYLNGKCRFGSNCSFYHDGVDPMPPGGVIEYNDYYRNNQQGGGGKHHHHHHHGFNNKKKTRW